MEKTAPAHRIGVDAYQEWVEAESVPVHEGMALNLLRLDTADWPRFGVNGAAVHFLGRGDFCSMFLYDIRAGRASLPVRHLYEAIYFVLEGRGSTQLQFDDGRRHQFEWGPRSFFAIPINATYQHFNASGKERALLVSTTTAPLIMKIFRDAAFVFGTPHDFTDRIGKDEYFTGGGDLHALKAGYNFWETNFVPDLNAIELTPQEARGKGSTNIIFSLAGSMMHAHIAQVAPATYKKAHRHAAGAHVMTLTGEGYSLLWYPGDDDFTRVDWEYGTVFPPCEGQFHQHFVTSDNPSRYLATAIYGSRYPLTEKFRHIGVDKDGKGGTQDRSLKDGGDQLEYEDQDPRIHAIWLEEMRKNGITPRMEMKF
jgi:mannose-6-phosphate isomerase-like protein (cupin superfamily)